MLNRLLSIVDDAQHFPLEVSDIADIVCSLGFQDEIIFSPFDFNTDLLFGSLYRYKERPKMYAEPMWIARISFASSLDMKWQRIICCKELVHICASRHLATNTSDQVHSLFKDISTFIKSYEKANGYKMGASALSDIAAVTASVGILFPSKARIFAAKRSLSTQDISDRFIIPEGLVEFALRDNFEEGLKATANTLSNFQNI